MSEERKYEWGEFRSFMIIEKVPKQKTKKQTFPFDWHNLGSYKCPTEFLGHLGLFAEWIYFNFKRNGTFYLYTFKMKENSYGKLQKTPVKFAIIRFETDELNNWKEEWLLKPNARLFKFWRDAVEKHRL